MNINNDDFCNDCVDIKTSVVENSVYVNDYFEKELKSAFEDDFSEIDFSDTKYIKLNKGDLD